MLEHTYLQHVHLCKECMSHLDPDTHYERVSEESNEYLATMQEYRRALTLMCELHALGHPKFSMPTCTLVIGKTALFIAAEQHELEGRRVSCERNGRRLDGEVLSASAKGTRFTIEWHDGSQATRPRARP